jgi:hypothetical protein
MKPVSNITHHYWQVVHSQRLELTLCRGPKRQYERNCPHTIARSRDGQSDKMPQRPCVRRGSTTLQSIQTLDNRSACLISVLKAADALGKRRMFHLAGSSLRSMRRRFRFQRGCTVCHIGLNQSPRQAIAANCLQGSCRSGVPSPIRTRPNQ